MAYACRHSRTEDRHHGHRSDFPRTPQPATNVSATNVFHRPKWSALTALTPGIGGPSGVGEGADPVTVLLPSFPQQKLRGRSPSGQPLDFIGGAKRDRTVDLYNAIVVDARLLYIPGRDVSRRLLNSADI